MTTTTTRRIAFHGDGGGTAPCTVGQWDFWRKMRRPGEPSFADTTSGGLLPEGLALDEVLDGLRLLIERHQSLRTLFHGDDHALNQEVLAEGELTVWLVRVDAVDDLHAFAGDWRPRPPGAQHDPAAELPFAARIVLLHDRPVVFQLWMSHLAADFLSGQVVAAEFVRLLQGGLTGVPRAVQPAEKAVRERSPRGRRALEQALDHWRRELAAAPPTMFPAPTGPPATPRFWRGGLRSRAVPLALDAVAARHRVGTTHVLLAAATVLLGLHTGRDRCAVRLMAGNRAGKDLHNAVGNLAQETISVIGLGGETFGDVVREAWKASFRAQRHGQFDADLAARLVAGSGVDLSVAFNDLWTPTRTRLPAPPAPPGESSFAWERRVERASVTFFLEVFRVVEDPHAVRLSLLADTAHFPPPVIPAFLSGIENLLAELADRDLPLSEIAPVRPAPRPVPAS